MQKLYLDVKSIFLFLNFRKEILVSLSKWWLWQKTPESDKMKFLFTLQNDYLVFYFTNLSFFFLFVSYCCFNEWGVSKTQCNFFFSLRLPDVFLTTYNWTSTHKTHNVYIKLHLHFPTCTIFHHFLSFSSFLLKSALLFLLRLHRKCACSAASSNKFQSLFQNNRYRTF